MGAESGGATIVPVNAGNYLVDSATREVLAPDEYSGARAASCNQPIGLPTPPVVAEDGSEVTFSPALLRRLATSGRCVVVVLHALDLALRYADRVVVIDDGRIVADAPPQTVLPAAAQAFRLPFGPDLSPRLLPPERPRP